MMQPVPRRPYGSLLQSIHDDSKQKTRLSDSLPIIGLGCSSFSNFFSSKSTNNNKNKIKEGHSQKQDDVVQSWISDPENEKILEGWIDTIIYAVTKYNINLLDTAPWYGHGLSEAVIGLALEKLLFNSTTDTPVIKRSDLIIQTKVGRYEIEKTKMFDFSSKRVKESIEKSLERMKYIDYIDVIQLHDPEFSPSISLLVEETIPALLEMRNSNKVKAIGITGYPLEVQYEILKQCYQNKNIRKLVSGSFIIFDQSLTYCHYNLHDQSLFTSLEYELLLRDQGGDNIEQYHCFADIIQKNLSMGLICAAPFSMGLLTNHSTDKPVPDWHPASDELKHACKEASHLVSSSSLLTPSSTTKLSLSKLAVAYALANERIPCTLIGMSSREEVDFAADIALKFSSSSSVSVDRRKNHNMSIRDKIHEDTFNLLKSCNVLTELEMNVLKQILDLEKGPFSILHNKKGMKEKSILNQWDGIEIANEFWKSIPGGKKQAEKQMRIKDV